MLTVEISIQTDNLREKKKKGNCVKTKFNITLFLNANHLDLRGQWGYAHLKQGSINFADMAATCRPGIVGS